MEVTPDIDITHLEEAARKTGTYTGMLLVFMPVIPIIATLVSIATFIVQARITDWNTFLGPVAPVTPLLAGTISAFVLWLLLAYICRSNSAVNRANEKSYYGLLDHLSNLHRLSGLLPGNTAQGSTTPIDVKGLPDEVKQHLNDLCTELKRPGISWVTGNGYIELWKLMNSAEEALISSASRSTVICNAVYDEMRLNDSRIENSEEWTNKLRSAVKALDPEMAIYLKPAIATPGAKGNATDGSSGANGTHTTAQTSAQNSTAQQQNTQPDDQLTSPSNTPASPSSPSTGSTITENQNTGSETPEQIDARAILRKVRETINNFNTDSWDGLITARNQLLATMFMVALVSYIFVEVAILLRINPTHLIVATILAFFGALAGLFGRLYNEAQTDTAIDDYRLARARLMVTPLLSALAAVLGVLIVAKSSSLDSIYTFNSLVSNIIIAAVFGLTPNLLINQLKSRSDNYQANLKSTEPTTGK